MWIVAKSNQPTSDQNAGRIFRDPHGVRAADLIEQVGMKGVRVGGAVVSDRHANFIVAGPGATSQDVLRLMDQIRGRVEEQLDIQLEHEIDMW